MSTYSLHLILLECLEGQELDGDEPYIKLNGDTIWTWQQAGRKMHDTLGSKAWTNAFDFRTGKFRTLQGWEASEGYKPGDFDFTQLSGEVKLELWEADEHEILRGDDDFLGEIQLSIDNARLGEQVVVFNQSDAMYQLTFRLSAD